MDTFLGRYKNLIVLVAILFAQIVLWRCRCAAPRKAAKPGCMRLWAISAVTPVEKAVVHTQDWVQNTWTTYAYLRGVRRENRRTARRNRSHEG